MNCHGHGIVQCGGTGRVHCSRPGRSGPARPGLRRGDRLMGGRVAAAGSHARGHRGAALPSGGVMAGQRWSPVLAQMASGHSPPQSRSVTSGVVRAGLPSRPSDQAQAVTDGKAKGGGRFRKRTESEPRMHTWRTRCRRGRSIRLAPAWAPHTTGVTAHFHGQRHGRQSQTIDEAPPGFTVSRAVPSHHVSKAGTTRSSRELLVHSAVIRIHPDRLHQELVSDGPEESCQVVHRVREHRDHLHSK